MSELHNRLEHLVNYSSQLIFVSGDTVADQQRILSDFLASQQENTEISFINASADQQASDYRGAICRQLAGHTVGSFVRPLNQLLVDLPANDGPYLVCITAADFLEESFLQELWDWVMHSQQGQENIHLNVILFGKSSWAESSQEWLPSLNSHKPVLLSSQSVNSAGFDVNALEALMANDSNWFNFASGPVVSNKWFIGGVLSVFFATFVGLISWQYPQEINQLLTHGEITSLKENQELPVFDIQEQSSEEQNAAGIVKGQTRQTNDPYILQLELVDEEADISKYGEATGKAENSEPSVTDDLLVSTWQEGIASSQYNKGVTKPQSTSEPDTIPRLKVAPAEQFEDLPNSEDVLANRSALAQNNKDGDFRVPDIISIEQLDRQLDRSLALQVISTELLKTESQNNVTQNQTLERKTLEDKTLLNDILREPAASGLSQVVSANNAQQLTQNERSVYRFDESTLLKLPTDAILLQLSGIQNPVVLENYLASNDLKANTWIYETQRYGGPWYVVVYRQSFESIDAALNRMSSLPAGIRDAEPFAKSVNQIQQEIKLR